MFHKKSFIVLMAVIGFVCLPFTIQAAGTVAEIDQAVESYYVSGDIYDGDVYGTLIALVDDAYVAPDQDAENAIRVSIVDICNAFKDAGITVNAANAIIAVAQ